MKQVSAVLCLLIAGAAISAPAPLYKERRGPPQVTAGDYWYQWGEHKNNLVLSDNGHYEADYEGLKYFGFWMWDRESRTLLIWESYGREAREKRDLGIMTGMQSYGFVLDDKFNTVSRESPLRYLRPGKIPIKPEHQLWF